MIDIRQGDKVRVRAEAGGEWCEAIVLLSSGTGAVALDLGDGMVRTTGEMIGGVLPLMINEEERSVTGLTGDRYEINVALEETDDRFEAASELKKAEEWNRRFMFSGDYN